MLRTAVLICLAAFYHATAAPYTAVAATDDHTSGEAPKIVLSMAEDEEEPDIDDGSLDFAEASPEDEGYLDDLAFINRDIRSKNFLRFGRSASRPSRTTTEKEGNTIRLNRADLDDNFIRLGRSTNFVRLGRGSSDTPVKTPSTRSSSNFIRLGRGKGESNFIRLGRGKNDFIRLGRDGNDEEIEDVSESNESLARMSRGGNADRSFIRLGKSGYPSSNFVRLGRRDHFLRFGKADNFIRLGRGGGSGSNFIRLGKKADNFLRFGKGGNSGSNFIRLGKKADNFLRFGKGGGSGSNFIRLGKKANNFVRLGRGASNYDDGAARFGRGKLVDRNFIRLGRSDPGVPRVSKNNLDNSIRSGVENTWSQLVLPTPRTIRLGKRESELRAFDNKFMRFGRDPENLEEHGNNNRSKRSTSLSEEEVTPGDDEYESVDRTAVDDTTFRYYYPLAATIPNYFAPELSVLPPLYSKRGNGNKNFIRFG